MKLRIDLPLHVELAVEKGAQRTGQSVAEFAAALLIQVACPGGNSGSTEELAEIAARLAALERIGHYDTRARAKLPPLSDEASSRESIYEARGL
jgi:hypothetical protein